MSLDDAQDYVQHWTLNTAEQAAQSIRFVTDPTWRAYTITYSAGRDLCGAYVGDDPAKFAAASHRAGQGLGAMRTRSSSDSLGRPRRRDVRAGDVLRRSGSASP